MTSSSTLSFQKTSINPAKIRVLIVNDYMMMQKVTSNLLKQIGISKIDMAPSGAEALRKIKEQSYDLVISNWNMSSMSGLELAQKLRADPMARDTPIILMTADQSSNTSEQAREAKVQHILIKPFNANGLRAKIEEILGSMA